MSRLRPDFNSSQKLSHVLLNGNNYLTWAKTARVTLKGKSLLRFINGAKRRPEEGIEAQDDWKILDRQSMTLITNSFEPQLLDLFVHCETALELWKEPFAHLSTQARNSTNHARRNINT
jgi:gag-polypeptide of LTR copia-type